MFSGDGARAFTDLLPASRERVIYAEHFNMPNNISNLWMFPIGDRERVRKLLAVNKKLELLYTHIQQGVIKKRGWGKFSHWLGLVQSAGWPVIEEKMRSSFQTDADCNQCGACTKL